MQLAMSRRCRLLPVLALSAVALAGPAQADDPRLRALRGIEALHISVATYAGLGAGDPSVPFPCPLDSAGLEQRGAAALRAAGLMPLTTAETMARNRTHLDEVKRDVQSLRAGPSGPTRDAADRRRLDASVQFMRNLPGLLVRIVAEPAVGPNDSPVCAVAVFATFLAPPRGRPTVAANGAEVLAILLLWSRRPRLAIVPAANLEDAALRHLDEQLGAFIAAWRAENIR